MGLFSSKKEVTVATSVMRIVEDDHLPQSAKAGVLRGIFKDYGMTESLTGSLLESPAIRIHRMYAYAKQHYTHGLPKGTQLHVDDCREILKAFFERELHREVTLGYSVYGPLKATHVAWQTLFNEYGYTLSSNELSVLSAAQGVPVYLKNIEVTYPQTMVDAAEPGDLDPVGPADTAGYTPERAGQAELGLSAYLRPSVYVADPDATGVTIRVNYVFVAPLTYLENGVERTRDQLYEGQLLFPVELDTGDVDFYQVMYHFQDDLGNPQTAFWTYRDGSGEYPEIDGIFTGDYAEGGSYFPFVYFRYGGQSVTADRYKDTEAYQTSTKMLNYLGLDFAQIGKDINRNPSSASVLQAFMMMAVPAESTHETDRRYLFQYFSQQYLSNALVDDPSVTLQPKQAIRIRDAKLAIGFNYAGLFKKRYAGVVAKVGKHDSGVGEDVLEETYRKKNGVLATRTTSHRYLYYRKQVTASHYDEVRVYKPRSVYFVVGDTYYTVGGIGGKKLLVPLDKAVSDSMPLIKREELYLRSLHFVFNSYYETETKWYESSAFKIVMIVITVLLLVFSGPAGASLAAALDAGMAALAYTVVSLVVESIVVQLAINTVVKLVGPEWAMVIALVTLAYGGYKAFQAGGLAKSTTAQQLLKTATNLVDTAVNAKNVQLSSEYNGDLQEFELLKEKQTEEMKEWEKLLETQTLLDPFTFVGLEPLSLFGESPTEFYNRTVHAGNIGTLGYEAVSLYATAALQLPNLLVDQGSGFGD